MIKFFFIFLQWCIVLLELPLKVLKAVFTYAVLELRKSNRNGPALPIGASIVIRLLALQQLQQQPSQQQDSSSSANNNNNPWETANSFPTALHPMTSEAARRDTFASWPHMDYKFVAPLFIPIHLTLIITSFLLLQMGFTCSDGRGRILSPTQHSRERQGSLFPLQCVPHLLGTVGRALV